MHALKGTDLWLLLVRGATHMLQACHKECADKFTGLRRRDSGVPQTAHHVAIVDINRHHRLFCLIEDPINPTSTPSLACIRQICLLTGPLQETATKEPILFTAFQHSPALPGSSPRPNRASGFRVVLEPRLNFLKTPNMKSIASNLDVLLSL